MRIFVELFTVLLASAVVGLWTYAWLLWCFKGSVRHWVVLLMPERWKGGKSNAIIDSLSAGDFVSYLMLDFKGPFWVAKLLSCRYCLSSHIAEVGALMLLVYHVPLMTAFLAWAGGAAIANYFYKD